ncbi:DUF1450 domain-containing protein [Tumebacillus sp. DT12]|uniref:DUF1450 domain-containing protein n=1 Tax=Tumebacillus lacus TaxID=2995335 RepID=A0ABT3X6H3_9BACL|nr:DUF1450 domain-containing protein [Tumebacillus lacus]MCX7571568.1 DUF1450 domain-containing protein [Tumebacillus lacus]
MGEAKRIVDFCNGNLMTFGMEMIHELREKRPEWSVSRYGCLTNCGECAVRPFAIVDDEIVTAATPEELLTKLLAD